jgi:hypothetical protein
MLITESKRAATDRARLPPVFLPRDAATRNACRFRN